MSFLVLEALSVDTKLEQLFLASVGMSLLSHVHLSSSYLLPLEGISLTTAVFLFAISFYSRDYHLE